MMRARVVEGGFPVMKRNRVGVIVLFSDETHGTVVAPANRELESGEEPLPIGYYGEFSPKSFSRFHGTVELSN
jgi:hypothetical protein